MKHECSQKEVIGKLQDNDITINTKLDDLKSQITLIKEQIEGLVKLNQEVKNIKAAWNIGGVIGYTAVKVVLGITVILGALYSLREWLRK